MPDDEPTTDGEPRWLSQEEQRAWESIATLLFRLPGPLENQLQHDSGLTLFEYMVLSYLSMSPGRTARMSALARLTNSSLSRLSNVVTRCERRGWITRSTDPDDARYTVASLTDGGYQQVVDAAPGHVEAVRHYVIDPLTPAQLRAVTAAVDRIRPLLPDGESPRRGC